MLTRDQFKDSALAGIAEQGKKEHKNKAIRTEVKNLAFGFLPFGRLREAGGRNIF
jgi:hypothetical protein